jgi:hypothetical protein
MQAVKKNFIAWFKTLSEVEKQERIQAVGNEFNMFKEYYFANRQNFHHSEYDIRDESYADWKLESHWADQGKVVVDRSKGRMLWTNKLMGCLVEYFPPEAVMNGTDEQLRVFKKAEREKLNARRRAAYKKRQEEKTKIL